MNAPAAAEQWIDRVVREVLARLQRLENNPAPSKPEPTAKPQPASDPARLALADRVISLSLLEGKLAGVRTLAIGAKAIVTPAVRDELRRRGVQLVVGENKSSAIDAALVIGIAETPYNPAGLLKLLGPAHTVSGKPLAATLAELVGMVRDETKLAVLLTHKTAAAVCEANRTPHVRAALAADESAVGAAVQQIAANLLVIDPAAHNPIVIRRMVEAFKKRN